MRILKLFGLGAALVALAAGSIGTAQKVIMVCSSGCDFTSIQAAINSAPEGSTIQVKAGTYQENLVITKSLTLLGQGKEQTIIKGEEEGKPVISIESDAEIEVTLEGLTIAEAKYGEGGISITGKAKVTIKDSTVSGNGRGLFVSGSAQVSLQSSTVSGNGLNGLVVWASANVSLVSSTVSGNGYGLWVLDSANVSLVSSTVSGNGDDGLEVLDSANVSLVSSTVSGNGDNGLWVLDSANVSLVSSTVSGNRGDGLVVWASANVSLQSSTVSGNGDDGLDVWGSAQVELKESIIKENKGCGISVWSEEAQLLGGPNEMGGNGADLCGFAPASLRKPLVPQTDRSELLVPQDYKSLREAVDAIAPGGTITVAAGIYQEGLTIWKPLRLVGAGRGQTTLEALPERKLIVSIIAGAQDVVLEGLKVTGSQADGLRIYGKAELQDIEVSGNGRGLFVSGSAQVSLVSSTVSGNGEYGLWVWASANVSLVSSTVSGNGRGLFVSGSAQVSLVSSTVSGNGEYGLEVWTSANVSLVNSTVSGNGDDGLEVWTSANVSLVSSTVSGNGDDGLEVRDSANVSLQSSTVSGNGDDGLVVEGLARVTIKESTIEQNGTYEGYAKAYKICNGILVEENSQTTIIDSIIRNNTDWGVAAWLRKCGYAGNYFTGKVEFLGTTVIEGNNTSGNQNGMGNPGNHPWNQPGVPDGQVCLP